MSIYGPVIINLKHREDRLKRIISQFETYKLKYQVCEAIYNKKDGHTGCLASHIKALEMLPEGFDAIWICEDDCELTVSPSELNEILDAFMKSEAVGICLGYKDLMSVPFSGRFRRTFGVFSGGCYLIKRSIYDIYLHIAKISYDSKVSGNPNPYEYIYYNFDVPERFANLNFADRFWQIIMQSHLWLIPLKHVAIQYESFSDIQNVLANPGY
jgi:hypothetical protein